MNKHVTWENQAGVGILTLNRPEKHNALNDGLISEIKQKIMDCETDGSVKVLVLKGAGKSFCAGGDLEGHPFFRADSARDREKFIREAQGITLGMRRLPQPVIAAVHGVAGGAGLDLALGCDIRIASEDSRFGVFFTRVGLMPDMGGTYLLPRLVGTAKALELLFTGDLIDAREALRIGLINQVVPKDALEETVKALADRLAKGPLEALRVVKWTVYRSLGLNLETALDQEVLGQNFLAGTRDVQEGIRAFREGRKPLFTGT